METEKQQHEILSQKFNKLIPTINQLLENLKLIGMNDPFCCVLLGSESVENPEYNFAGYEIYGNRQKGVESLLWINRILAKQVGFDPSVLNIKSGYDAMSEGATLESALIRGERITFTTKPKK